jgi:hypothetical protein
MGARAEMLYGGQLVQHCFFVRFSVTTVWRCPKVDCMDAEGNEDVYGGSGKIMI